MAKGITNAKIISGGSGGGDTVYAVSETALNKDDKVYLNKHYYDSYDASAFYTATIDKTVRSYPYVCNNGDVYRVEGSTLRKFIYNSENKNWTESDYITPLAAGKYAYAVSDRRDGEPVFNMHNPRYGGGLFLEHPSAYFDDYIARKDLLVVGQKTASISLVEIASIEPATTGQTYSTFVARSGGSYISTYSCSGNTLLITEANRYFFYDISDLTAPVQIKSGQFTESISVNAYTGLSVGDYLFTRTDTSFGETGNSSGSTTYCKILKIMEDYSLQHATDLPSEFYTFLANPRSTYVFNRENNTLAIGDENSVNLYKYENGTFRAISYSIPLPTEVTPTTNAGWCLYVSEDLSTAVVCCCRNSSGVCYNDFKLYKMVNNNDNWYAEDYIHSNALSLQGFATGKTNDKGEYEVSTVLPAKVNLTINTNVDTEVEIFGSVE